MASLCPKVSVRAPRPAHPLHTGPLPAAASEGQQVAATALRATAGSVKSDLMNPSTDPVLQCHIRAPRPRWAAVPVKTEQNCSLKQGEKLSHQTPISATISSTFPGPEGLQVTAPAMRPGARPPVEEEDNSFSLRGRVVPSILDLMRQAEQEYALRKKREQKRRSASPPAVDKVKGLNAGTSSGDNQKPRAERLRLSFEDLVSDSHMRLEDKAAKLQVSTTLFKSRRRAAGLGRWPGKAERARIKRAQAQAHA